MFWEPLLWELCTCVTETLTAYVVARVKCIASFLSQVLYCHTSCQQNIKSYAEIAFTLPTQTHCQKEEPGPTNNTILLSITNKMQCYTIFFITVNALHVSGGFSAHHQELKTASGSNKQAWRIPDAVCTVLSSWWLVAKPPETCRALTVIKNTV